MIAKRKPEVILLHETWIKSLLSDLGSYATVVGIIGTGWWLGSTAMEWAGFVTLCLFALAHMGKQSIRYTIPEARAKLDELERK